jgi:hypothetical protein
VPSSVATAAPAHAWSAGPATAGFSWHKLTLVNGWKPFSSGTGSPSWAVKGGVVYLSGALRQPAGSNDMFARLPKAARPAHLSYLIVYTLNASTGNLIVSSDGTLRVYSNPAGNAQGFTSLASISYPAASMATHKLFTVNGWASGQGFTTGDPSYSVSGGVVHLSGSAFQPMGSVTTLSYLPHAAWPNHNMYVTVYTGDGTIGELVLEPGDGEMQAFGPSASSFISLAGVSYPVAKTAWHKLKLLHGWAADHDLTNSGNPSYAVMGGVVYLAGTLHQLVGGSGEFAVLPRGSRPTRTLFIKTYNSATTAVALMIEPSGKMFAVSAPASVAQGLTSLAAISFPISS